MTTLVVRRALLDYARRPLNVMLLVAVPVVIVVALGGELASMSKLLSTTAKPLHLETATAGWAAAAVAGLAGFFQVVSSRAPDRRLAATSVRSASSVLTGRLVAAACLAGAAAGSALVALAAHGGLADPGRAIPIVAMVALLYAAIGVVVGTLVRSEMNGALIVSVIWMLDVFVGSGVGGSTGLFTRLFPLHFPTMILTSQAAHHAGPVGDLGWSLIWTTALSVIAAVRLSSTTRPIRLARFTISAPELEVTTPPAMELAPGRREPAVTATPEPGLPNRADRRMPRTPWSASLWAAARDYRRNHVLWALLLGVPALFVALAAAETPTAPMPVALVDSAREFTTMIPLRHIHAGEMAAIASALLAGVAGLFVVTGANDGDRRLVLAGFKPRQVLAGHLGVIVAAALLTSAVSIAVSAAFFTPQLWPEYVGAILLIALTYAMIGVLLGPLVGRLGGLYLLLLLSIVDVGYGQTVMFHPLPPAWGAYLPTRGAGRLVVDGSFTSGFEQYGPLLLALAWLAALTVAAALTFRRQIGARSVPHLSVSSIDFAVATGSRPRSGVTSARPSSGSCDRPSPGATGAAGEQVWHARQGGARRAL
jgi:hypothetical protein